jgi:hypothetical protein
MTSYSRPLICIRSYEETCKCLGYPNFAVLQLRPVWGPSPKGEYRLAEAFPYSVLEEKWALFESWALSKSCLHQRLRGPAQENQPAQEKEFDEEEFEMVTDEWLRRDVPPTVSAFRQDNGQSTAQDNSILLDPGAPLNPCQRVDIPIVPTDTNVDYQIWQSPDDMHLIQFFDLAAFSSPQISTY